MIMLGFNTVMSGKTIIDQTEISLPVGNPSCFFLFKQIYHREEIQRLNQEMITEVRELVFSSETNYHSHLTGKPKYRQNQKVLKEK